MKRKRRRKRETDNVFYVASLSACRIAGSPSARKGRPRLLSRFISMNPRAGSRRHDAGQGRASLDVG